MKICRKCGVQQMLSEFTRDKANPDKLNNYCKTCRKAESRQHYLKNPEYYSNWALKDRYGVTIEQKQAIFEAQGACCACCGSPSPRRKKSGWCLDHDHATGKIRAVLCNPCNAVLGYVQDSIPHLEVLIAYLKLHAEAKAA